MFTITKFITATILLPFNILILWLFSLICFGFKWKKLGYLSTFVGITILYLFSIPYTSYKLQASLTMENTLTIDDYKSAQAIILLGNGLRGSQELFGKLTAGGTALERMRYAAFLQKETGLPLLITGNSPSNVSEAAIMKKELEQFFYIPTQWLEEKATTTAENAKFSKNILAKEGINKVILVTNQWHMQRAKLLFEKEGFDVLPANVGEGEIPNNYKFNAFYFTPQSNALHNNMLVIREWLGYWKEKY